MLFRAEIDRQDLVNVERDTRRWLSGASITLYITVFLLFGLLAAAAAGAYVSVSAIARAAAQGGDAGLAAILRSEEAQSLTALLSMAVFVAGAAAAYGVYRARCRLGAERMRRLARNGLTVGRFEYALTDKHLIIKGPLGVRKVAWAFFTRIEDTKTSIVFWRDDGGFEFIPKNVLPINVGFDKIRADFQPRIEQGLAFEEALHAAQSTVTFERLPSDMREFRAHYFREVEGRLSHLRGLFAWTPGPALLFSGLALIAVFSFYVAGRSADLMLVGVGAAAMFSAAGLALLKPDYFLGAARPLMRRGGWPFAQSTLSSVTLSKEAVLWRERGVQRAIQWDAIAELVECPLTAYLVMTPDQVIALPKRAFISARHYYPFIGFANARIAAAARASEERKEQRLARSIGKQNAAASHTRPAASVTDLKAAAVRRVSAPQAKAG